VHVEVADGVLQAGLHAALWEGLSDGVDVELGDLGVVVRPAAGTRPPLLLLRVTADRGQERIK